MYENVIDKKGFIIKDGEQIIDFTTSVFKQMKSTDIIYNIYRVPESMIMRPDLLSLSEYNTDEYTDILLKYNNISNPFSLDKNDIIILPTINSIGNDIEDISKSANAGISDAAFIRNYHRYIDKSKAPSSVGSENNSLVIDKTDSNKFTLDISGGSSSMEESNLSQNDNLWVTTSGDRIYFNGSTPSTEQDYNKNGKGVSVILRNGRMLFDDPNNTGVDCGIYGMTSSNFMVSKIENDIN